MTNNKAIEYPYPVLNEFSNDFIDCEFSIDVLSHSDMGKNIEIEVQYCLNCPGIENLLKSEKAKIILRLTCYRTSFRIIKDLNINGSTIISIPKNKLTDILEMQASIVANEDFSYCLDEFNKEYFGSKEFPIHKGNIIANEPGIKIKLNTILEKNASGVVQVTGSPNLTEMQVSFAGIEESDPALSNYIVITLPDNEYKNYAHLMTKKHLKNGVERFLQASLVLPAITEAISKLRYEEIVDKNEDEPIYKGTVWADSIIDALLTNGVDDLSSCERSDYELANLILGNVANDAINNLMQKMSEWSTIRQEDDI